MNRNQETLIFLIVLGAAAQIKSDPIPNGYEGYGDKSLGGSLSRYEQEYSNPYGPKRDFDEGHKEDIEQESIKYHSLVNKALNTAKDADRFVGDSIKEQEKSQKDHIRYKRSVVPLASTAKKTFRPIASQAIAPALAVEAAPVAGAPQAEAAPAAGALQAEVAPVSGALQAEAAPVLGAPQAEAESPAIAPLQPLKRQQAPIASPVAEMEVENTLPQVAAAKQKATDYEDEEPVEQGAEEKNPVEGQGEIDPEKIDEMIDLMNSLNQKFAKMIANWDDYAANHEAGGEEAGANLNAGADGAGGEAGGIKRKGAKSKKKASKPAEEEGDYEAPEEEGEETVAEDDVEEPAVGATKLKRAKRLPQIL